MDVMGDPHLHGWPASAETTRRRPPRRMLGAARRLARRAWLFVRHDLPELAAPSSLPTPPAAAAAADARKRRPRLTLADHREARWVACVACVAPR